MVVLLTILMLAYLLGSSADRRLSDSSLNQTISDQLAHSASDIIIGDLKEEIANSSTLTPVGPSGATSTITIPVLSAAGNYSSMLPMTNSATATIPNLVRISVRNDPMASPGVGSRASAASTGTASLNNRLVTAKIWNSHFLIPLQNPGSAAVSSTVPDSTPSAAANFTLPDWVFFTGSGPQVITAPSSSVIGRYAYAIYDEGGLLDVNVAGQPVAASSPSSTGTLTSLQASNKSTLALIDLTNLLDGNPGDSTYGQPLISAAAENAVVGWRNYASLQSNFQTAATDAISGGQFPAGFSLTSNNANDFFFNFGRGSSSAYLKANNLATGSNNLTDQIFITRQQLISMQYALQQTVGFSPSALQYLTTYSRSLDQPSFAPNASRPKTASYTGDPAVAGSNSANGQDNTINPSFLTIRAPSTVVGGRNDGSSLTIGEPLVKKRFALNRLAWITYEGPLADGTTPLTTPATSASMVNSTQPDLTLMAQYLHNTYGLSYAFLQQGTAANIYNYFGLSWVADTRSQGNGQMKWLYNHSSPNASNASGQSVTFYNYSNSSPGPLTSIPTTGAAINTLSAVAGLSTPREPDFFELLKAGIVAGSKGRNATLQAGGKDINGSTIALGSPDDYQNKIDSSLDFQIIQIGANIIAQSRLDGYAPQILYNDGTTPPSNSTNTTVPTREFSGVENLPYIYSIHQGVVQGRPPTITNLSYLAAAGQDTGTITPGLLYTKNNNPANVPSITDPGFNVLLQFPVIWNAHDQNNPRCAIDSSGSPLKDASGNPLYPTSFRIVADSIDPDDISSTGTAGYQAQGWKEYNSNTSCLVSAYPSFGTWFPQTQTPSIAPAFNSGSPWTTTTITAQNTTPPKFVLTAESTAMTFTINESVSAAAQTFFREPTLLISPNVPVGSNLAQGGSANYLNPANQSSSTTIPPFTSYPSLKSFMDSNNDGGIITTDTLTTNTYLNLNPVLGIFVGTFLGAWYEYYQPRSGPTPYDLPMAPTKVVNNGSVPPITYRMQYYYTPSGASSGTWVSYDTKFAVNVAWANCYYSTPPAVSTTPAFSFASGNWASSVGTTQNYDPRTGRFAMPFQVGSQAPPWPPGTWYTSSSSGTWSATNSYAYAWLNFTNRQLSNELMTQRPDYALGWWMNVAAGGNVNCYQFPQAKGWPTLPANTSPNPAVEFGLYSQNSSTYTPASLKVTSQTGASIPGGSPATSTAEYYQDADGVVRRGMAAYWPQGDTGATGITGSVAAGFTPGLAPGLPMATASTVNSSGYNVASRQVQSRPIILHRPFRSVAELGYVFSGTPWKNLDFFTPESGDGPLLDVFCIDDSDNPNGMVAGKVNLNTRQKPVLQTILTGAYKDEEASYAGNYNPATSTYSSGISTVPPLNVSSSGSTTPPTSSTEAYNIAAALYNRTSGSGGSGPAWGPLEFISDLVGRYTGTANAYGQPYDGFSADLTSSVFTSNATQSAQIQRFREAPIRALSAVGQTRVWNLLIDVIAQTGNFPSTAKTLDNFYVKGQQRYWVHVAIDRFTGQVIDKQIEVVQQ
jgi:hypothetical protein